MQFPQYVVYTSRWGVIHCYQGLWFDMYQTHITRPIKLLPCTVCVSLQTPTIVRAGQAWSAPRSGQRAPVDMGHHLWAGAHGHQGASVHELKSPRVVSLFWVLTSTSNWSSNCKTISYDSSHQLTPILYEFDLWVYNSYGGPLCHVHALYNSYAHKFIPFSYHSLFGIQIFQLNTIL